MKTLPTLLAVLFTATTAQAQQEIKGDAKAGAGKVAMCIGCHGIPGYQSSFPVVYKVPKISGQNAKFIAAALDAYRKGERRHPTMRGIAESLSDQDIADVAAFYAQHGDAPATPPDQPAPPPAEVAGLLQRGACASCHGANYNKPIDGAYPKIAGQYADYLYHALTAYKADPRATFGRTNPVMGAQVKAFSGDELKLIANYLGSLPGELRTVRQSAFR